MADDPVLPEEVELAVRVTRAGRLEALRNVLLDGIERRDERRGQGRHEDHRHHTKPEQGRAPAGQAAQEHLPLPEARPLGIGEHRGRLGQHSGSGHRRRIRGSRYV